MTRPLGHVMSLPVAWTLALRMGALTMGALTVAVSGHARSEGRGALDLQTEDPRRPFSPPQSAILKLEAHGGYHLRATGLSDLRLRPYRSIPGSDRLGQTFRLAHWHRLTARFDYGAALTLVGQLDAPRGLLGGQTTEFVADADPSYARLEPVQAEPRWLYAEWRWSRLRIRAGQQPSHWGLGMVENDGDHPTLFGDPTAGVRVARLELTVRPMGKASPLSLLLAGDIVFQDPEADLRRDELAVRALSAVYFEDERENLWGLLAIYRHQRGVRPHREPSHEGQEELRLLTVDSAGRFGVRAPGGGAVVFGAYEVAVAMGDWALPRTAAQALSGEREALLALGAAVRTGVALIRRSPQGLWSPAVVALDWGWASGDANPYDGVSQEFRFHPSYNVGLVLFEEVLAWQSARSAAIGADPQLGARPLPASTRSPTDGAVANATYVHPSVVVRPWRDLDLTIGSVIAASTADLVDPVRVQTDGEYVNHDGGRATRRDLGLELDAGAEYRLHLPYSTVAWGLQGGLLFPGHAFDDAAGVGPGTEYLGVIRFGFYY